MDIKAEQRWAVSIALVVLIALSGCSGIDPDELAARAATISAQEVPDLGEILVDGEGSVLYMFEPDDATSVTCTFTCAGNWPPLDAVDGEVPGVADGVDADLLGTLPNPGGGQVITYGGWPLYRYEADRAPGDAFGQGIRLNGGNWFVMAPNGEPVR